MSGTQSQNYHVNYTITVNASEGVGQIKAFAKAVKELEGLKNLNTAVQQTKSMMTELDKIFRPKGKNRKYVYDFTIKTNTTEQRLERVKGLLTDINALAEKAGVININTGKPLPTKTVKAEVNKFLEMQKPITQTIGKINSALTHLNKPREIKVKAESARKELREVLTLLQQIRTTSLMINLGGSGRLSGVVSNVVPFAAGYPYGMADRITKGQFAALDKKARAKMYGQLYSSQTKYAQRHDYDRRTDDLRRKREERQFRQWQEKKRIEDEEKKKEDERRRLRDIQRRAHQRIEDRVRSRTGMQRGAINRLQYTKMPTLRSLPMGHMFNAYMGFSLMRNELGKAIDYSNIMESAHSILKVADTDLSTFESRFERMARYVRQIGVETKFSAIEIGGAVKYLAMAGMDMATINASIRPVTNLALIGDNDVDQIADLATNIMAGYNVAPTSMNPVADILASTVSRSNVNIIEMAESYKMAAGYMKLSGVDFSESAAAIGVLGNMGVKATMAGTALRAMATRFAKPPKEARETMDRLGIRFTHFVDIYGKKVEKLRPLADIFKDLKEANASLEDMVTIFGKIGGNAGMMFLTNYEKLKELTIENRASHGISEDLAKIKQETTKGLWFQVKSQFSEAFMQGYQILEPQIQVMLREFLDKFSAPKFAAGLSEVGRVLLDILSVLGSVAAWFTRNFHWLEPLVFSTMVSTRLFKLAAAITNVGVAIGFLGKKSVAASGMRAIGGLPTLLNLRSMDKLSFADKREMVILRSMYRKQGGIAGLFGSQVTAGNGLVGAAASLGALGGKVLLATTAFTALAGALGWVAYKTWKVKEAKDAVVEEIKSKQKFRYPSIDALHEALAKTHTEALAAKDAVDRLTSGKTVAQESGFGFAFSKRWWAALFSGSNGGFHQNGTYDYNMDDAYQDEIKEAIERVADKSGQERITAAWAEFGKFTSVGEIDSYLLRYKNKWGQSEDTLDESLYYTDGNGMLRYHWGLENKAAIEATKTPAFRDYMNNEILPRIHTGLFGYRRAIANFEGAKEAIEKADPKFFEKLEGWRFSRNKQGEWVQGDASEIGETLHKANAGEFHDALSDMLKTLRRSFGDSPYAAETILKAAGFTPQQYANEPQSADEKPWDANPITNWAEDDGKAGGNYSGTGKLSSTTPKQVIVTISNLLSIDTIQLLGTPEGRQEKIQDLKEQMAQALIDVVHDFDASWNG